MPVTVRWQDSEVKAEGGCNIFALLFVNVLRYPLCGQSHRLAATAVASYASEAERG